MDTHTSDDRHKTVSLHRASSTPGVARQLSHHTVPAPFLSLTQHDKVSAAVLSQPEFINTDFSSSLFSDDGDGLGLNLTTNSQKTMPMMNRVVSSAAPYQQPSVVRSSFANAPVMQVSGVQFAGRTPTAMPLLVPQQPGSYGKTLAHTVLPPGAVIQQQPQQGTMFICMPVQQQQQQQLLQQQQQQRLPQQQQQQQQRPPQQQQRAQKSQSVSQSQQPATAFQASAAPRMIGQPNVSYQPLILDGQFTGQSFLPGAGNTVFMPVQRMPAAAMQRPQQLQQQQLQQLQPRPLHQQQLPQPQQIHAQLQQQRPQQQQQQQIQLQQMRPQQQQQQIQQQLQQQQLVTMAAVRSASVPLINYVRHIQPKSVTPPTTVTMTTAQPNTTVSQPRRRRRQWHQMFINNRMPVRFTPSPALPVTSTSILSVPKVPLQPYMARPGTVSTQQVMSPVTSRPLLQPRYSIQQPPSRLLVQPQLQPLNMVVRPPIAIAPRSSAAVSVVTTPGVRYKVVDTSMQPTDLSVKSTTHNILKQPATSQPSAAVTTKPKRVAATPSSDKVIGGKAAVVNEDEKSECVIDSTTQDEGPVEYDDFMWEDYLQDSSSIAAPPTSFRHVECSLESGFEKSMKLEVANKQPAGTYWVASIVMTCGQLLRLRHEGVTPDDSSADFWCDVISSDIHPIGWCRMNDKKLQPPEELRALREDWDAFLEETLRCGITAPAYLLDGRTGTTPVDQIKAGMRLEVQHDLEPSLLWIVKIHKNVGGRLLLRYEGIAGATADYWLFYLDHRLHPIGWAQQHGCIYKPPTVVLEGHDGGTAWTDILSAALKEAQLMSLPPDIFKDQTVVPVHGFKADHKLEALHPLYRCLICPATVAQIIDDHYVLIKMDSLLTGAEPVQFCCHASSWSILPVGWCVRNSVTLTPPAGWTKDVFSWPEYLTQTGAVAAADDAFRKVLVEHGFEANMKVEAMNPDDPAQVCPATITRIVDQLMWLHLDSEPEMVASFMTSTESHDIFPVGWCESNGYELKPPLTWKRKRIVMPQPKSAPAAENQESSTAYTKLKEGKGQGGTGSTDCPKIYFNHRCFSGPFLSKGRIAALPKSIGPGNVCLVMKEVLSMLINVAYKSSRVLRELQMEGSGTPGMQQQVLKAKYKGKSYRAMVDICKTSDQIEQFCRQVCLRLECCPNLVSPHNVNGRCPERCFQLTKTKYTHYYGKKKKRKIGRPPGGHSNLENGQRKPGKRRKRKKLILTHRKKCMSTEGAAPNGDMGVAVNDDFEESSSAESMKREYDDDDDNSDSSFGMRKKRRYMHRILPPTEICTRGARRPRFTFERRTHQKILLTFPRKDSPKKYKMHAKEDAPEVTAPLVSLPPRNDTLQLKTNPLNWSIKKVVEFMKTTDCAGLSKIFNEQEIDGQALLLLTLPAIQEHLELKLGPAVKLCHHVERIKVAFFEQFAR